jgi:hypothetical protein
VMAAPWPAGPAAVDWTGAAGTHEPPLAAR